jgi:hypothetical protein
MRWPRLHACAALVVSLSFVSAESCTLLDPDWICLRVIDSSADRLTVEIVTSGRVGGHRCAQPTSIRHLGFRLRSEDDELWGFGSSRPRQLSRVSYGVVPDGYNAGMEPPALTPGMRVRVVARGYPTCRGFVDVTITP